MYQVAAKQKVRGPLGDIQILTSLNMLVYGTAVTPFASMSLFINGKPTSRCLKRRFLYIMGTPSWPCLSDRLPTPLCHLLLAFMSISCYCLADREFFASDSASGLYPVSAYYVAQMTVELVVRRTTYMPLLIFVCTFLQTVGTNPVPPWPFNCPFFGIVMYVSLSLIHI